MDGGEYKRTQLPSGLRVLTERMPHVRSVSAGIWIDVGSRNEATAENGISHFIEHMRFKGTRKRNALEIAQSLESLGGLLNAFTTREQTCYYVRVLDEHFDFAMDVLSDILTGSLFDPVELERERMVILEEIKDLFDTPAEVVHDHFAGTFWNSHPLGKPIMGAPETVANISRDMILEFIANHYTADRIVVAAAGNVEHQELVDVAAESLSFANGNGSNSIKPPDYSDGERLVVPRDSAQTHVCLGLPTYSFHHPGKYALLLINNILGGGMGSRLFQSLREKHGLAYTVYSTQDFYHDTGVLSFYIGTEGSKVRKAVELILEELAEIKKDSFARADIDAAKSQMKGSLLLTLEGSYSRMTRLARHEIFLRSFSPVDQTIAEIEAVTDEEIKQMIDLVFDPKMLTMVALGPVDQSLLDEIDWSILK